MAAYYNEIEPFAVAWLRELMKAGLIADGTVDERPIEQVEAADLKGFRQCHFFAGIGVWSHSLRAAGWPDDSPVWTGSCPCQSFSASGKRGGFSDKRHLWPAWFRLIEECAPHVIFGEQVASKDGLAWLDVVSSDLEGAGYALGAADTCAAGFGAPHIRQRLYFVADALQGRRQSSETFAGIGGEVGGQSRTQSQSGDKGYDAASRMADAERDGGRTDFTRRQEEGRAADGRDSQISQLADTEHSHGRPQLGIQREAHGRDGLGRSRAISDLDDSPSPRLQEHELRNDEQRTEQRRQAGDLGHADLARPQGLSELAGAGRSECSAGQTGTADGELADSASHRRGGHGQSGAIEEGRQQESRIAGELPQRPEGRGLTNELAESLRPRPSSERRHIQPGESQRECAADTASPPSLTNGFWSNCEWLPCRDGKWRPAGTAQSSIFALADGLASELGLVRLARRAQGEIEGEEALIYAPLVARGKARVGRLRGYGNSLVSPQAQGFIEAYSEAMQIAGRDPEPSKIAPES